MNIDLSIFKDYDIRGVYPTQINGEVFAEIAHAIVRKFHPKTVAICRDMRISGQEIQYYITGSKDYDLAIMISASHNPPEYNGIKLALKGPVSISGEGGLY